MVETARALARQALRSRILDAARVRLTGEGPAQLSLRAVARDVGMVSSAVYRYFPSRDDLLTALLVQDYDELGEAVERADAAHERTDVSGRWTAACRAVRTWSLEHPGDFALLYGSPVPGYAAPQETIEPATRVTQVLVRIAVDAMADRAVPSSPVSPAPAATDTVVAPALAWVRSRGITADAPAEAVMRTIMAWTTLFGAVSFELFGHTVGVVADHAEYFDRLVERLAADIGFSAIGGVTTPPPLR
jgi:AcrR family transcriptional regulator